MSGVVGGIDDAIRDFKEENLRDPAVQEKLIREYLRDFDLNEETIQEVLTINHRMNAQHGRLRRRR